MSHPVRPSSGTGILVLVDARSLVFGVQDEIRGRGRLVRTSDGDWFDPPLPVAAILYIDGRPTPSPSRYAVPVEGADFAAVEHRYERDGAIDGHATIYGRWLGARISVQRQTTERLDDPVPRWSEPPCPPPAGGWPRDAEGEGPEYRHIDLGDLEESGAAVTRVIFRPGPDRTVLVVVAADVAAVEARLRPQLGDRLCVVPSRCSRGQLDEAREYLWSRSQEWGVYETGESCDEEAQVVIGVRLVRVTDEIARWAGAQPAGLVALKPFLTPVDLH